MKTNLGDIKTYAICLEREMERRGLLTENLSSLDIEAEFIGIDGEHLPTEIVRRYSASEALDDFGRELTHGEIGCYGSHLTIWEKIVAGEEGFSLVLESDAVLTREAVDMVELIRKQHSDVDLVMLSYADCIPSVWERRRLSGSHQLVRFSRKSYFASAYLLNRKGAAELIRHSQSISMPADEIMVGERIKKAMSIYAVYPRIVYLMEQAYDTSTLRDSRLVKTGGIAKGQAEKLRRSGLARLEQIVRHFIIKLRRPRQV